MWGLLLLLVVMAGLTSLAAELKGHGVNWAYHACLATGGLCDRPEWLAAGAALAGVVYLMRNRISA